MFVKTVSKSDSAAAKEESCPLSLVTDFGCTFNVSDPHTHSKSHSLCYAVSKTKNNAIQ